MESLITFVLILYSDGPLTMGVLIAVSIAFAGYLVFPDQYISIVNTFVEVIASVSSLTKKEKYGR